LFADQGFAYFNCVGNSVWPRVEEGNTNKEKGKAAEAP